MYKDLEKSRAYQRARYKKKTDRQYHKHDSQAAKYMWQGAKRRAEQKGLPFTIEPKDIVIPEFCPVFGLRLVSGKGRGHSSDNSPSLDRRDNRLGYIKSNIAVISHRANRLKGESSVEELRALVSFMTQEPK